LFCRIEHAAGSPRGDLVHGRIEPSRPEKAADSAVALALV
jgi:hypothetical protein